MIGFCIKQTTAYEMLISYWSSDVCSSDLRAAQHQLEPHAPRGQQADAERLQPISFTELAGERAALLRRIAQLRRELAAALRLQLADQSFQVPAELRQRLGQLGLRRDVGLERHRRRQVGEEIAAAAVGIEHLPDGAADVVFRIAQRSEEHTSELQSLMRISYAVFCL